ncbi:response regulator transcription factor [Lacimicrobium sp. SS2-24]|uniref:response regulator transcription factor n=1 Tax=Lacimicrobium sp. SS2-24 TaxID=2005569 RepID=UPI000B4B987E|nr:response regulator transcription factor [Lacimicrobium sp. SS2-24]
MRILIVEDEKRVASFLSKGLLAEGHQCECAYDGEQAIEAFTTAHYDVIILDRMLPGIDGMAVLREIRKVSASSAVLMLTALNETEDKILGLRMGADDYLGKPFDFEELLARIEALARRTPAVSNSENELRVSELCLNTDTHKAYLSEQELELTRLEFELLRLFMNSPGKVLSRERILSRVWGSTEDPLTNVIDVYIRRLRVKLSPLPMDVIETVRGVGYRLKV